jgi:hypothetical protein
MSDIFSVSEHVTGADERRFSQITHSRIVGQAERHCQTSWEVEEAEDANAMVLPKLIVGRN